MKFKLNKVNVINLITKLDSKFGGEPYIEIGEIWPICQRCKKELDFIFQIDLTITRNKDLTNKLASFYYCFKCKPWGSEEDTGSWFLKIYTNPSMDKIKQVTNLYNTSLVHPCSIELNMAFNSFDFDYLGSQINGTPYWLQPFDTEEAENKAIPKCTLCKHNMKLLFQICSEEQANLMWADNGIVYLFYCLEHQNKFELVLQSN